MNLSQSQLDSARSFLENNARNLELARFSHTFGDASADSVVSALDHYRNPDGGYGRALEPDCRSAGSTVLATCEALGVMADLELRAGHPSLDGAIGWLTDGASGFEPDNLIWPYLPANLDEADHAPWWDLENLSESFDGFVVNPRARILAYLYRWRSSSRGFLEEATGAVIEWCDSAPDETSPDTLRSLLMLAEAPGLPQQSAQRLETHVERMIPAVVVTDRSAWSEYGLQPTEVADSPESRWLPLLRNPVANHLDHLVQSQQADGSWKPFWSWMGNYPEAWKRAEAEWAGVLTLRNLNVLRAYDRFPGSR